MAVNIIKSYVECKIAFVSSYDLSNTPKTKCSNKVCSGPLSHNKVISPEIWIMNIICKVTLENLYLYDTCIWLILLWIWCKPSSNIYYFQFTAQTNQRKDEGTLLGERWKVSGIPPWTESAFGEYGFIWHRGWKSQAHTGSHLDYYSQIPGR